MWQFIKLPTCNKKQTYLGSFDVASKARLEAINLGQASSGSTAAPAPAQKGEFGAESAGRAGWIRRVVGGRAVRGGEVGGQRDGRGGGRGGVSPCPGVK